MSQLSPVPFLGDIIFCIDTRTGLSPPCGQSWKTWALTGAAKR